jgi:hypothetical protein
MLGKFFPFLILKNTFPFDLQEQNLSSFSLLISFTGTIFKKTLLCGYLAIANFSLKSFYSNKNYF